MRRRGIGGEARGAGLAAVLLLACGVAATETPPPGAMGRLIVPGAVERPDADQAWRHVQAMIDAVPAYRMAGAFPGTRPDHTGYFLWQEFSNRLLRETGLAFCHRYPGDARCWIWLQATRERAPQYWNIAEAWLALNDPDRETGEDAAARSAWRTTYLQLRDAAIGAEDAPSALRLSLRLERIEEPLQRQAVRRLRKQPFDPAALEIDALGGELRALGEHFPGSDEADVRGVGGRFFSYASRYAPAAAAKWADELIDSPNRSLRELAAGERARIALRSEPMQLRFAAIDGREVDLAQLRGNVVLLEFRGITWCAACRAAEPYLKETHARYHDQGFKIVTITHESDPDSRQYVLDYTRGRGLVWPHYFDGLGADNPNVRRFGITGVPAYFLLNRDGLLVSTDVRGEKLEPAVRKVLGLR